MGRKTPPFPEHPAWTQARFFSFLRSALRKAWQKWPPKYKALDRQAVPYKGKDKRRKKNYICESCGEEFMKAEVEVNHVVPCGSLRSFEDLPGFVQRMFVGEDKLEVLCKECHESFGK